MGDNQLGMELMGHSKNDRTRYSVALLSSNDGQVGLPARNAYSTFVSASQAFDAGSLGVQRLGAHAFVVDAPTCSLTSNGLPIPGSALGNKPFNREGVFALLYLKKLDFSLLPSGMERVRMLPTSIRSLGISLSPLSSAAPRQLEPCPRTKTSSTQSVVI